MTEKEIESKKRRVGAPIATAVAGSLVLTGGAAHFPDADGQTSAEAAQRIEQLSQAPANPTDAALESGEMSIDLAEKGKPTFEYEHGAFQYDPQNTCHMRDAEWLAEHGLPSAYIMFVYERAGIDPETATMEQKIEAFKDAMKDCYTKDPYIFAGNQLMLENSTNGEVVTQEMINAHGEELAANPALWQQEFEEYMALFESPDATCSIGHLDAQEQPHWTLYTSDVDTPGTFGIYMAGPSVVDSDVFILQLANGQSVAFKECLQPAWNTGDEMEIPSGGLPHLLADLPILDSQQCEPDGFPVLLPPPLPKFHSDKAPLIHDIPAAIVPDVIPDYAAMTGNGIDHSKGSTNKGYATVARNHKQPTFLNNGNFSGNRKGRGRTSTARTPNARRGR